MRFEYQWLDETFREMATYVFFVLTGYKFRPASTNPYFTIPSDEVKSGDEDDRMDVVYVSKEPTLQPNPFPTCVFFSPLVQLSIHFQLRPLSGPVTFEFERE